ncbi:hypothetical protein [Halobacillus yeomjeoni]|uniref:Helix-turn-helix domain-containing protein n=1 Tax=Halobacillus yeomjeoni TaxID=311194 RepID=A0A931HV14_9BACI|nr:hypothetical protein [Halobacillus yeomjeoni]MBH0229878.1 hypothetical protein [Halobacillus yeomjeoni]
MFYVLSTLASVSILLFILSFFVSNRFKALEEQLEQLTMTMMQNNYQTKQKMKVLEEELLAEDLTEEILKQPYKPDQPVRKPNLVHTIQNMYEKGYTPHYIAKQTDLSEHDIQSIVRQWNKEGGIR